MKRNSILAFLSIFVSIQFGSSVYSQTDDLLNAQDTYEPATRGLIIDMIDAITNVGTLVKKVDNKTKKINDTVDDIEDDVKDLLNTNNVIQDKACDIQSTVDDLLECCPCDTIIKQSDIPFTISVPGTYCLGENVNLQANQTAITLNATDCVTLDLKGHAIDGKGIPGTRGILVDGIETFTNNVTIRDGFIKNMLEETGGDEEEREGGNGIVVKDSFGPIMIMGIKVTNCEDTGIEIENSSGVVIDNCESSFNDEGIGIENSTQCIVRDCLARGNNESGIEVESEDGGVSSDCCLIRCQSYENNNDGFCLSGAIRCNLISCIAHDNQTHGYEINGKNNVLLKCIANHNDCGFRVVGGEKNIIRHCVSSNNTINGYLIAETSDNQVGSNCAIGNGVNGFANGEESSFLYNNAANNNGDDFEGIVANETTADTTIGFWANVTP